MKKKVLIGIILAITIVFCSFGIYLLLNSSISNEELVRRFIHTYLKESFHPQKIALAPERLPWEKERRTLVMKWNTTSNENFYLYLAYNSDNKTLSHIAIVVYPNYHKVNASLEDYFIVPPKLDWNCTSPSLELIPEGFKDCRASWSENTARIDVEILSYEVGNNIMMNLFKMFPSSEVFNLKFGKLVE